LSGNFTKFNNILKKFIDACEGPCTILEASTGSYSYQNQLFRTMFGAMHRSLCVDVARVHGGGVVRL